MKPIKEFLGDTKPKNVETIRKALEKGEGVEIGRASCRERV